FDLQMFMGTRGRERTLAQWQALFARAGLTLQEVVGLRSPAAILVLGRDRQPAPPPSSARSMTE
ncbi:MAG TPA: hypothetical protein VMB75_07900, partial [Rhodocyclaceae bacterium]|nr:hypothetical protein [Rhodocyclaceae bacterium]